MPDFKKFPSIGQFRDAVKQVQQTAKYHSVELPKVTFTGTVKLHGTNAAIVCDKQGWHVQSRERVITPESDNAGFAAWVYGNKEYWNKVHSAISGEISEEETNTQFQIFGEWCGGNIQKNIGLNRLPKMFVIFAISFCEGDIHEWYPVDYWRDALTKEGKPDNIYFSTDFPTYDIVVDFNNPALSQNELVQITEEVEKDCPVARKFLPDCTEELIGEGIVWSIAKGIAEDGILKCNPLMHPTLHQLRFKVKGEKHSSSKVKVLAEVDPEKVKSIAQFVEYACTNNRLEQGLNSMKENLLEISTKNTGEFIRWVMQDILKEELDVLVNSGIEPRDVNSAIAKKARDFYMSSIYDE